jgi:hypothetical protein
VLHAIACTSASRSVSDKAKDSPMAIQRPELEFRAIAIRGVRLAWYSTVQYAKMAPKKRLAIVMRLFTSANQVLPCFQHQFLVWLLHVNVGIRRHLFYLVLSCFTQRFE